MKKKFSVTGMHCAACQANVERATKRLEGVNFANVSLLSASMMVDFDPEKVDEEKIIDAVTGSGYGCSIYVSESVKQMQEKKRKESKKALIKLIFSIAFLICLMVFSMGPMIANWPSMSDEHYGEIMSGDIAFQIFFLIPIILLNRHYFPSGYKSLFKGHPNMDSLVAMGSTVSTLYGLYNFVMVIIGTASNDHSVVMNHAMNIYFESAAMILTFVSIGKYAEGKATGKTTSSIAALMEMTPSTALFLKGEEVEEVLTETLKVGDKVMVKPGMAIPADGIIIDGHGSIDESAITGESLTIDKEVGAKVIAATTNISGTFVFEVTSTGEDTTISHIISLVNEAVNSKAPISRLADRISLFFVPTVIGLAIITFVTWLILTWTGIVGDNQPDINLAFQLGISVLVISCPCALGLATPAAIMVGIGKGAECGLIIKSAEALETLNKVDYVIFDKTGTLTKAEMVVSSIVAYGLSSEELLQKAAALEASSQHPFAKALVNKAKSLGIKYQRLSEFIDLAGKGVASKVISIGNKALMEEHHIDLSSAEEDFERLSADGSSVLYVEEKGTLIGLLAIKDEIKESSYNAISALKKMGKQVVILTGDNALVANEIATNLGVDKVFAEILPGQKEEIVAKLQADGHKVAVVGDGVNDAPALTKAYVGIAIGAGTDVAIESADIVLIRSNPEDVVSAFRLSHKVVTNVKENLAWAFAYNIILIPLAAGCLYGINVSSSWFTGEQEHLVLSPMIASIAMSLSSVTVVLNALRLRLFKAHNKEK